MNTCQELVPASKSHDGPMLAGFYPFIANRGDMRIMGRKRIPVNVGDRHGMLTFVREVDMGVDGSGGKYRLAEFMCDCGEITTKAINAVLIGRIKSCGCFHADSLKGRKVKVSTGDRYGSLVAVEELEPRVQPSGKAKRRFRFDCDCGTSESCLLDHVRTDRKTHCGECAKLAARDRIKTHGMVRHPAYQSWGSMQSRCSKNSTSAHRYHDRGIKICPEWRGSPVEFCKWADENGYKEGLELDRRDNSVIGDRAYSPENCRFISHAENSKNKQNSMYWHIKGSVYDSLSSAAIACGVSQTCIHTWVNGQYGNKGLNDCWTEKKYPEAS